MALTPPRNSFRGAVSTSYSHGGDSADLNCSSRISKTRLVLVAARPKDSSSTAGRLGIGKSSNYSRDIHSSTISATEMLLCCALDKVCSPGDVLRAVIVVDSSLSAEDVKLMQVKNEGSFSQLIQTGRGKKVAVQFCITPADSFEQGVLKEASRSAQRHADVIILSAANTSSAIGLFKSGRCPLDSTASAILGHLPAATRLLTLKNGVLAEVKSDDTRSTPSSPLSSSPYSSSMQSSDPFLPSSSHTSSSSSSSASLPTTSLPPHIRIPFTLLQEATNNFAASNKLGAGGAGQVFLGVLPDGDKIAVKRLTCRPDGGMSGMEMQQYLNELTVMSRVHHRNLLKLRGASMDSGHLLLAFDLLPLGSLDHRLRGSNRPLLTWQQRVKIILDAALGLHYLHDFCDPPIIHRDVKTANILLKDDFHAVVADFNLAKFVSVGAGEEMPVTHVIGTRGYLAPEYWQTYTITKAIDVFAFGVVILEVMTGHAAFVEKRKPPLLSDYALEVMLSPSPQFGHLVDSRLESNYSKNESMALAMLASLCISPKIQDRPTMEEIIDHVKKTCKESLQAGETP